MSATQKKVIEQIKRIARGYDLDADFEFSWANVGHVYFRLGFETVANAHLDFQSGNMTIALNSGAEPAEYFGKPEYINYIQYGSAQKFQDMFNAIEDAVQRGKAGRRVKRGAK